MLGNDECKGPPFSKLNGVPLMELQKFGVVRVSVRVGASRSEATVDTVGRDHESKQGGTNQKIPWK